jgi:glycosyltransferase involved in cell wall biosynthesis
VSVQDAAPRVILVAHDIHDEGGMERALAELIRNAGTEIRFCVVSAGLSEDLRGQVEWRRIRVPRRPFILKFLAFYLLAAVRLAASGEGLRHTMGAIVPNRVDIAAVQFCHAGFREALTQVPAVERSSLRRVNDMLHRSIALWAERWSYRRSRLRAFVAASRGIQGELARFYPHITAVVAPNGVDHRRFRPDASKRAAVRSELDATDEDLVALFVGGDWPRKGLDIAIEALARADGRENQRLHLWVVGSGDIPLYERFAESLGVASNVTFFGRRRDTEVFYQAADVFLFPTFYEAFPLVALEAAACGLPIVAAPINGIEELISDGAAGIACERLPAAFADALSRLAVDPELRRTKREGALQVSQRFTWESHAETVNGLYRELVGRL